MKWFRWFNRHRLDVKDGLEWLDVIHEEYKIVSDDVFYRMRINQCGTLANVKVKDWHRWAVENYILMVIENGFVSKKVYVQLINLVNYHGYRVSMIDDLMEDRAQKIENEYEFESRAV